MKTQTQLTHRNVSPQKKGGFSALKLGSAHTPRLRQQPISSGHFTLAKQEQSQKQVAQSEENPYSDSQQRSTSPAAQIAPQIYELIPAQSENKELYEQTGESTLQMNNYLQMIQSPEPIEHHPEDVTLSMIDQSNIGSPYVKKLPHDTLNPGFSESPQKLSEISYDDLKSSLEKLFVYYCEFSLDKGQVFIKQASFTKLLKDAQIQEDKMNLLGQRQQWKTVTEKEVNLLLSKELNNPLIKSLDFQSFLNMLVKLALLLQSKKSKQTNPKVALEGLLNQHILPLLENIEESIRSQRLSSNHISSITLNGQYIANISIESLQQINLREEDIAIMRSLKEIFRVIYEHYFVQNLKNENVLKKLFRYLKDFELSPYLVNTKTAFMIYYFTSLAQTRPEEVLIVENNSSQKEEMKHSSFYMKKSTTPKMSQPSIEHPELTFNQFLIVFFRLSVVFFDMNYKGGGHLNQVANFKKLISLLTRVELTRGFSDFLGQVRISKSIKLNPSLTPPKALLTQLYLNEKVFSSQGELEYIRDVHLEQECDSFVICKMLMDSMDKAQETKQKEVQLQIIEKSRQDELEIYLEQVSDALLKIFQKYCSYGDPLNTDKLKSQRFIKMFQDLDLIEEVSQITMRSPMKKSPPRQQSQAGSNKNQKTMMNIQIDSDEIMTLRKVDRNEIDLVFKKVAAQKGANFLSKQSVQQQSQYGGPKTSRRMASPAAQSFISTTTKNREGSMSRIDKEGGVAVNQNHLNYQEFRSALFELSKLLCISKSVDPYQLCIQFIKYIILPLSQVHQHPSGQMGEMLHLLESEEVINLLSELHQVIIPIYQVYANAKTSHFDFAAFIKFLTDFSVFPDVVNKSEAYKIFMNLAFKQETTQQDQQFNFTRQSFAFDQTASLFNTKRGSVQQQNSGSPQHVHVLDIHLFVEALAFCALNIDSTNTFLVLKGDESKVAFEKILMLIEKMSVAEGLKRTKDKKMEDKIKANGIAEKIDIMAPFRTKYQWYFEMRDSQSALKRSLKIKNQAFKQLLILDTLGNNSSSTSSKKQQQKQSNVSLIQRPQTASSQKSDLFGMVLMNKMNNLLYQQ